MRTLEVSYKSMTILETRFKMLRNLELWVPDWNIKDQTENTNELDVLIMGSFFERIFQPEFWPNNDFNFFCLSTKSRQCLLNQFGFDEEVVGLLNRKSLFPPSKNLREFNLNSKTTLIYAGRLSPQKNIEFLIFTVFYLQLFYSSEIKLQLMGDFDNIYHKEIIGCPFTDYRNKIFDLIAKLPWVGDKPEIINNLDESEWLGRLPENGIFISSSNLISEDFSVSAAQLEELGYPMLLPYWGGFVDVDGSNIRHYPVELISSSHDKISICSNKAKIFSQIIIAHNFLSPNTRGLSLDIIPARKINKHYLEDIYSKNLKRWGSEIALLRDKSFSNFALSTKGQAFFEELKRLMAN